MTALEEEQPEEQQQQEVPSGTLGQQVRLARELLGLSREAVAHTLRYAETTIYKIENGTIPVSQQFIERWNKNFDFQLPEIHQEPKQLAQPEKPRIVVQQESLKAPVQEAMPTNTMQFMFSPTKGVRLEFFGKINDSDIRRLIRLLSTIQESWPTFP